MKRTMLLIMILIFSLNFCEEKKKKYIPIQTVAQQNAPNASSTGNAGTTISIPSSGEGNTSISGVTPGATVTVTPSDNVPFTYTTTTTVPVDSTITNNQGTPISGVTVVITNPDANNVLLQQNTDSQGHVAGSITVPSTTSYVNVTITSGGETCQPVQIPLQVTTTNNGNTTTSQVSSIGNITIPISNTGGNQLASDRDGDGVDDNHDFYPDDPKKATKIRFPASSVNTIAFEDLYPNAGDADLNDYVVQFFTEEDLNSDGKITEIRGAFQHVARGAGYRHTLNLLLPNSVDITFESTVTDANGVIQNSGITVFAPTSIQLDAGLQILGNSGNTIPSPNSELNQTYSAGHIAKFKIVFNTPVARSLIGASPYNVYLKVIDTGKNIFFPGKYFDGNGKDLYMDANGFPWAIQVPGVWAWPLERQDIRNIDVTGYPKFNSWATSKGLNDKDWYKTFTLAKIFPIPAEPSNLLAYLKGVDSNTNLILAIGLSIIGLSIGLLLRKRFSKASI